MRILHIVTAFPRSTDDVIVPWLVELIKRLQGEGHTVEVLTSAYRGGGGNSFDGIPVHRFRYFPARWEDLTHDEAAPDRMRRSLLYKILPLFYVAGGMWASWRRARRERYDIIHVHWPVPHMLFGWMARLARPAARVVSSWYGVELRWVQSSLPWLRWFVRWALRASDAVVAISSYTAREIARFARVPVRVIPYTLGFKAGDARRVAAGQGPFRVLFVGRLVERKGVTHLIDAVRQLSNAQLTIIGDGPERAALEAQAAPLGNRVVFRGRVSATDLRAAYAATHAFVLPSTLDARGDTEGLGVVLLEAMSFGVPVVASDIGGITDIVENERTGLLVPPSDAAQLARALKRLADEAGLAERLGSAGRERVRTTFGWPEIMAKWRECYGSLAEKRIDTASATARAATPPRAPAPTEDV